MMAEAIANAVVDEITQNAQVEVSGGSSAGATRLPKLNKYHIPTKRPLRALFISKSSHYSSAGKDISHNTAVL